MNIDKEECKRRNALRTGKECVPESAIDQHFKRLRETTVRPFGYGMEEVNRAVSDWSDLNDAIMGRGEFRERLPGAPWVICDVDGTLAENEGGRSQYDETKVLLDSCREPVAAWLRGWYSTHNIAIFSGRHSDCSTDTVSWLEAYKIPFDIILMRASGDYRSDVVIKNELLHLLLKVVPKQNVKFVLDDRPKVIEGCWKANGIKVFPVGGTTQHSTNCTFDSSSKGWRRCPSCWALEDF